MAKKTDEIDNEIPAPGTICPCCKRRMPGKRELTDEEIAERREEQRQYRLQRAATMTTEQKEEQKVKQREYRQKRSAELKRLRELAKQLETEAATDTE